MEVGSVRILDPVLEEVVNNFLGLNFCQLIQFKLFSSYVLNGNKYVSIYYKYKEEYDVL